MSDQEERIVEFLAEVHNLTRIQRTGWVMAGVSNPESVSDHCFEAAIIAYLLAEHLDLDVDHGKVVEMLLFHELGESRLTDIPRRGGKYVKAAKSKAEQRIISDLLWGVSDRIESLLTEFHECETLEARVAESAEELQIIFAALMYARDNNGDMTEYIVDATQYPDHEIALAKSVAAVVESKLRHYVGSRNHWSLGYRRKPETT